MNSVYDMAFSGSDNYSQCILHNGQILMFLRELIKIVCALKISEDITYTNRLVGVCTLNKLTTKHSHSWCSLYWDMELEVQYHFITTTMYEWICIPVRDSVTICIFDMIYPYLISPKFYGHVKTDRYVFLGEYIQVVNLINIWFNPNLRLKMIENTFHVLYRLWW